MDKIQPFVFTINNQNVEVETMVTNQDHRVKEWVDNVMANHPAGGGLIVVGMTFEMQPLAHSRIATMQLCVGSRCIIIQLLHLRNIPPALRGFLKSPRVVCVGVDVYQEAQVLWSEQGLGCTRTTDLWALALRRRPLEYSNFTDVPRLRTLAHRVLGLDVEQHVACSNWSWKVLSDKQLKYACLNAFASHAIGKRLL